MNKRKKVVLICSAATALVVAASVGITLAYLGDTTGVKNTIIVGHGDEEISEQFSEPSEIKMSNETDKKFYVRNTGTVPCFARLYAEFSDSDVAAKAKVKVNGTEYTWADFKTKMAVTGDSRDENLPSDWVFVDVDNNINGDKIGGYFYYTKVLQTKDDTETDDKDERSTTQLFDSISYSFGDEEDSNIDKIHAFEMIVYSETVQTTETYTKVIQVEKKDENGDPVVDGDGNPVTEKSTVYGYVYKDEEWMDAWKSYLRQPEPTPEEPDPKP